MFNRCVAIPACIRNDVFLYFHCHCFGHHQGGQRMEASMKSRVWWPGMSRDVRNFVAACYECQVTKQGPDKRS